ncbi:MAG TPA: hypothetical protein VF978_06165 [Gemmatimonadales bacterium]
MSERPTPFALVFDELARDRFPAIARALEAAARSSEDGDAFVLLEPVAHLLRDVATEDAGPEEIEAHLRLLHHAYRHWAAGGWVYRIGDDTLVRATTSPRLSSHLPRPALYLQLPAGRVWRPGTPPEPLDGAFVTETTSRGEIAVLAIFGMHRARPGFSAVAVEGRADAGPMGAEELEVAAARTDGSPLFSPQLQGGGQAGIFSVATAGEMLLLVCRLLALLPVTDDGPGTRDGAEQIVVIA